MSGAKRQTDGSCPSKTRRARSGFKHDLYIFHNSTCIEKPAALRCAASQPSKYSNAPASPFHNFQMIYKIILPLLAAALIPSVSAADPVIDDFSTIPNLGANTDSRGGLLLASDGNFYGVVGGDGTATDAGSIFKMTPAGVVTTLAQFTGNGGTAPGNSPRGRLLETPDGFLYGATLTGKTTSGTGPSSGTIFKVSKTGVFATAVNFVRSTTTQPPETSSNGYGAFPSGDLAIGTDGIIYGTTTSGGTNDQGTIWSLNPTTGAFATVLQFGAIGANAPVATYAGLVRGAGNVFYGLGYDGGASNGGCVFSFEPGVGYQLRASLTGVLAPNYGNRPTATLSLGADGKLYGTTSRGGVGTNDGTTFRCSTSGTFEHLADLNANAIARTAVGLSLAPDGNFYGIGFNDRKVFRMTPSGAITGTGVLPTASSAYAPWTNGADGNLYTAAGGHIYRLRFSTTPLPPFAAWKQLHLGSAVANDNADPEFDGLGALAEYGLNLLPSVNEVQPAASTFDYTEGRRIRLILPRDPAHNDITVEVLATDNLAAGPWTVIATSALGAPFSGPGYFGGDSATPGIKTVEIRDTVNMVGSTKRFLKVRFTH